LMRAMPSSRTTGRKVEFKNKEGPAFFEDDPSIVLLRSVKGRKGVAIKRR
jgi:hypothetical protein